MKLRNFQERLAKEDSEIDELDEHVLKWTKVDRVVYRECARLPVISSAVPSDGRVRYCRRDSDDDPQHFVKWTDLGYSEGTWEAESVPLLLTSASLPPLTVL